MRGSSKQPGTIKNPQMVSLSGTTQVILEKGHKTVVVVVVVAIVYQMYNSN